MQQDCHPTPKRHMDLSGTRRERGQKQTPTASKEKTSNWCILPQSHPAVDTLLYYIVFCTLGYSYIVGYFKMLIWQTRADDSGFISCLLFYVRFASGPLKLLSV